MKSHSASTFYITFRHLDFLFPVRFFEILSRIMLYFYFLSRIHTPIKLLSPCMTHVPSVSELVLLPENSFSVCPLGYCLRGLQTSIWIHLNLGPLFSLLKSKLSYTAMYPHSSWSTPRALYLCYQAISLFIFLYHCTESSVNSPGRIISVKFMFYPQYLGM